MSTGGYSIWIGESGVLTVIVVIAFAVVLYQIWPLPERAVSEPPASD